MYAANMDRYGFTIYSIILRMNTQKADRSLPKLNENTHERLIPIEGSPVDLLELPKGCSFAPRCASCMKICLRETPPDNYMDDIHYSACWLRQKDEFNKAREAAANV